MNTISYAVKRTGFNLGLKYLNKDPEKNIAKIVDLLMPFTYREDMKRLLTTGKKIMHDPGNPYRGLILRTFSEISPNVRKRFLSNFVLNSAMIGQDRTSMLKLKYKCNIPWAILMDPTNACNLHCIGCWAAEYNKGDSMDYALLDRIIREGKELGIYFYIYSGGEPTVRKDDLVKLARVHDDCVFLAFTNGTLVDDAFAKALAEVGNFALAFSIEGFEEETDMRRGKGTYAKVIAAMDILKARGIPFGFSACYHRYNTDVVGSESFVDFMVEKGARFGWYFTYMPLGKDARPDFIATPDQREFMYRQVRKLRNSKPIFLMDFWNDGEFTEGCIAGGRRYIHINASGDVEPCAFIHYSNVNIRDTPLLDALKSPIFREYAARQPFNENHLRPCPLLDNPDALVDIVRASGAHSTQSPEKEDISALTDKCRDAAGSWSIRADALWKESGGAGKT